MTMRCSEYQRYKLLRAIHNVKPWTKRTLELFRISKIQTLRAIHNIPWTEKFVGCCSEYKRYKLLRAIRQLWYISFRWSQVVQNIKDTNFESNSQPIFYNCIMHHSCSEYQRYKLLRAPRPTRSMFGLLVVWISKIHTFESNSQPQRISSSVSLRCSEYQRYKLLRAIHNTTAKDKTLLTLFRISKIQTFESNSQPMCIWTQKQNVVQNIKDTNFWEQFTTQCQTHPQCFSLFRISKIQTFESNSQPQ